MNDYIDESRDVLEEVSFGESYDKELANYQGGFEEGREDGREEVRKEGREEGREEGSKNKSLEIATNLLHENIDIDLIIRVTGLTREEIENLK